MPRNYEPGEVVKRTNKWGQKILAYEYLCRIEEARIWIEACIKEELPPAVELEERLRNGVYFAKIANFLAPDIVPAKKIYDADQELYFKRGLNFRHTDNINYWLFAMRDIGLPLHMLPNTLDVYEKRNMPKAIYCIHSLSLNLYKSGKAQKIQNLFGKVKFTTEEINAIQKELERCRINIHAFCKTSDNFVSKVCADNVIMKKCFHILLVSHYKYSKLYKYNLFQINGLKSDIANKLLNISFISDVPPNALTQKILENQMLFGIGLILNNTNLEVLRQNADAFCTNESIYFSLQALESSCAVPLSDNYICKYKHIHRQEVSLSTVNTNHSYQKGSISFESTTFLPWIHSCKYLLKISPCGMNCLNGNMVIVLLHDSYSSIYFWFCPQLKYTKNLNAIVKIQSYIRMWLTHKKYIKRICYLKQNVESVKFIQTCWRIYKTHQDLKLFLGSNPSLAIIQKFVKLLRINDRDYSDALKLQRIRKEVICIIHHNQKLENELNKIDMKIGFLVHNRMILEELKSHRGKVDHEARYEQVQDWSWISGNKGLKVFNAANKSKIKTYEHLCYLLQREPGYLARLIFALPSSQSTKFVESVILTLYNYGFTPREEYLLLCFFRTALEEEIKLKVHRLSDVITGNSLIIKLVVMFYRNGQGQECLRELLEPLIRIIVEDKTLHINTNPLEVYKLWWNELEAPKKDPAELPSDISVSEAVRNKEVRKRLKLAVKNLKDKSFIFCNAIVHSYEFIPYGILYIAKVLKNALYVKFPELPLKEILKVIGNFLYYRYINSAIVAPDAFDIIQVGPDHYLTNEQRKNLGSVAKVLQFAASGKGFEQDSSYLSCLNPFISECHEKFNIFFEEACAVEELEEHFDIDVYSEATLLQPPAIELTVEELCDLHNLLAEQEYIIAPDPMDVLHEILEDLGVPPKHLCGRNGDDLSKVELSLSLSSKYTLFRSDIADIDQIYVETKLMLIALLHIFSQQYSVSHMIAVNPTKGDELYFKKFCDSIHNSINFKKWESLSSFQETLHYNLNVLELSGYTSSKNDYQDITNAISKDIRNYWSNRQSYKREIIKLKITQKQLDIKTSFYEEKLDYYNQYINTCLDDLARGSVNLHRRSFKKDQTLTEVKIKSLKYSGNNLHKKGILLKIKDLEQTQLKNISFEIISLKDIGVFSVNVKFMGITVEKAKIDIQELLHIQYQGIAVIDLFGCAKMNVNQLLLFLNWKFYKK